jgi:hypothetical protein
MVANPTLDWPMARLLVQGGHACPTVGGRADRLAVQRSFSAEGMAEWLEAAREALRGWPGESAASLSLRRRRGDAGEDLNWREVLACLDLLDGL